MTEYGASLPNLKAIYFDPYSECDPTCDEIHGICYRVRPFKKTVKGQAKSQLCPPAVYAERGDKLSDCTLYSIVAWDPVYWPGNDFFLGARVTDDGRNGFDGCTYGHYNTQQGQYQGAHTRTSAYGSLRRSGRREQIPRSFLAQSFAQNKWTQGDVGLRP